MLGTFERFGNVIWTTLTSALQDLDDIDEVQEEDSDGEEDDGHDEL